LTKFSTRTDSLHHIALVNSAGGILTVYPCHRSRTIMREQTAAKNRPGKSGARSNMS
jgi:hypothetical protein